MLKLAHLGCSNPVSDDNFARSRCKHRLGYCQFNVMDRYRKRPGNVSYSTRCRICVGSDRCCFAPPRNKEAAAHNRDVFDAAIAQETSTIGKLMLRAAKPLQGPPTLTFLLKVQPIRREVAPCCRW
jgi:hypothetical protein